MAVGGRGRRVGMAALAALWALAMLAGPAARAAETAGSQPTSLLAGTDVRQAIGDPKGSPIEVEYAFDASGRVRVRACDKTGGKEAEIEIERRGGLSDGQLDSYTTLADGYQVD